MIRGRRAGTRPVRESYSANGLLEQLAAEALEADYLVDRDTVPGPLAKVMSGVVTGLFGVLVAVAALSVRNDQAGTDLEREAVVENIAARQATVAAQRRTVAELTAEVDALESVSGIDSAARTDLRLLAADVAAQGEGIVIEVASGDEGRDGELLIDTDLQILVNGLWFAGAEAVAINGHRIGSLSAIRSAGEAITVNYRAMSEPYLITAIGDPDDLEEHWRANPSGRWFAQRENVAGVRWAVEQSERVVVPAAPRARLTLQHAEPVTQRGRP